jgi:hypothetical protein
MLIGGWGKGGFKLDLRQDCDPGKQELKGAVKTETYQRIIANSNHPEHSEVEATA